MRSSLKSCLWTSCAPLPLTLGGEFWAVTGFHCQVASCRGAVYHPHNRSNGHEAGGTGGRPRRHWTKWALKLTPGGPQNLQGESWSLPEPPAHDRSGSCWTSGTALQATTASSVWRLDRRWTWPLTPKQLNLGEIWCHLGERAFQELLIFF